MPTHTESRASPYGPKQLFDMVLDIERYPEFLPWCRASRILSRSEGEIQGELVIHFKGLTESYASRIVPAIRGDDYFIEVTQLRGPFKHLNNHWRFEVLPEGGSMIHFSLDFQFKTRWLDGLIGGLFSKAVEKMTRAFTDRADVLYKNA
jgi:coenzyme Q-binding protein COQ10